MGRIERYYVSSNILDAFAGRAVSLITQIVVVNQLGFTGTELGVLGSLPIILYLVSAVPIGKLVDSLKPVTVLSFGLSVKAFLLVIFTFLYISDGLSFLTILVLQVFQSLVGIFIDNSQIITAVSIQKSVEDSKLVARLESADKAVGIAAPGVVALIAAGEFYKAGYIASSLTAVCALLMVVFPVRKAVQRVKDMGVEDNRKQDADTGEEKALLGGFRLIAQNKERLIPVLLIASGNFGLAFIDSPRSLFLLREIGMAPSGFSMLNIVNAVAGLSAAVLVVPLIDRFDFMKMTVLAAFGQVLSTLFFLAVVVFHLPAFIFMAISGSLWSAAVALINVAAMNFFVSKLPQNQIGVGLSSMRVSVMAVVPLGAILGGYSAEYFGYAFSSIVWTAVAAVAFFIGLGQVLKR
ncbi:MFS transporter [Corynebacterium phoceense]|uniref:MFS transporter n=1 Tax=Corynebacterium phoceense TaxID=1686286 RepID=UPI00211BA3ED|nr:MFS transporter [Corynebacterium phoceense]MCQ9342096.1 MFS transporter [Corynebacterium phoceense]MCQ9349224.1 MFS transporter [Corynebacterium phoceense]